MPVTLVGAGPGDKGLLTLKGAERIRNADVVLHDRFVNAEILDMIPDAAEIIDVGKYVGNHPVPQEEINQILLDKAIQGLNVVRLKGGDPFVFGRGGEELELLVDNSIPFEVVPGVTSAIAGAAYAGVPVTHRDYASSFHAITGHAKNNEPTDIDFKALADAGGTLVFMMGVSALKSICNGCISGGMDKDMPAMVVENATYNIQRKFIGTVTTLPSIASENNVKSPAIIIVGKVCLLSERYDWFSKKPLHGISIIVARAAPGVSKLSEKLKDLGCDVHTMPSPELIPLLSEGCLLETVIDNIHSYSWLIFTSAFGVNVFFDYLKDRGFDIRRLHHLKTACVGIETERELGKRGIVTDYRPDEYNGKALAQGLIERVKDGEKLLIARAKDGAEDLTARLMSAGINYDDTAIYEMKHEYRQTEFPKAEYAAFTSSSAVDRFAVYVGEANISKFKAVCIGKSTEETAKSYGMETFISKEATIVSMVETIQNLLSK